jgi:crossover junction endodeoxyribonuclease RusA
MTPIQQRTEIPRTHALFLSFGWPDKDLSPNARKDYRQKAKLVSIARQLACVLTIGEREWWHAHVSPDSPLETRLIFYPPDKRKRDIDNLLASMKSSLDGIFDALETNDNRVRRTVLEWGDAAQPGRVEIEIREIAA